MVHHQHAMIIKTPKYTGRTLEIFEDQTVDIVMSRKNTDVESAIHKFRYTNVSDEKEIEHKRKKARSREQPKETTPSPAINNTCFASSAQQFVQQQAPQPNIQIPQPMMQQGGFVLVPCQNMQMPMMVQNSPQLMFSPNQQINLQSQPQTLVGQSQGMISQPQNVINQQQQPQQIVYSQTPDFDFDTPTITSTINMDDIEPVEHDRAETKPCLGPRYSVKMEDEAPSFPSDFNHGTFGGGGNFATRFPINSEPISPKQIKNSQKESKAVMTKMRKMEIKDNQGEKIQTNNMTIPVQPTPTSNDEAVQSYATYGNASSLLLDQKQGLFAVNEQGDNTLHLAIIHQQQKSLESVLQAMSKYPKQMALALNARNEVGQTPLHIAAYSGQPQAVLALFRAKADFRKADANGDTVLHVACKIRATEGASILKEIANWVIGKNQISLAQYLAGVSNKHNLEGQTALHLAVKNQGTETLEILEIIGSDPDQKDMTSGRTPLHYAVQLGRSEIVRHLLYKFHACPNAASFDNSTPLHAAVEMRNLEMVEMLMDKEADPFLQRWQSDMESGLSCYDLPECDEQVRQILDGGFPTLYEDLMSSFEMYNEKDKVLYLGVGAQNSLTHFLKSRAPSDDFLLTDTWTNFVSILMQNRKEQPIHSLDLLLSVLLNGGTRIGTLKKALALLNSDSSPIGSD